MTDHISARKQNSRQSKRPNILHIVSRMHEDPYAEPEDWSAKKSRTKNTKAQRIASPRITNNAKEEIRKMQRKREALLSPQDNDGQ